MEIVRAKEQSRALAAGVLASVGIAIGIFVGVHGYPMFRAKPIAGLWFLLGMAGITVCFINYIRKQDADDVVMKLFLTAVFFVLSIGWLLR
jgi:hypothetical protein